MNRMLLSVGMLVGVVVAAPAFAADTFWTHAAAGACQKSSTTGSLSVAWGIMVNNSSTQSMNLDCGDVATDSSGTPYTSRVLVFGLDASTTENVSCEVRVYSAGVLWYSGGTKSSSGSSSSGFVLDWPSIGQNGNVQVGCVIPKTSGGAASGINEIHVSRPI